MKRQVISAVILVALVSSVAGFYIGYLTYRPIMENYVLQINSLTSNVSTLQQTVSGLQQTVSAQKVEISYQSSQISSQSAQISAQETKISNLESEKSSLKGELGKAQVEIVSYKEKVNSLNTQVMNSQRRTDKILGITVTQHYDWKYPSGTWNWDLPIRLSTYVEYYERPRPQWASTYVDMAKDPGPYIVGVADRLKDAATKANFSEVQKLDFVVAFVQSLPYTQDKVTTTVDEYPRYPLETLFDRGGDCEDTSILVAALLDRLGYDVALLDLASAHHMAVGVAVSNANGLYYEYSGKKYYYLETTGEGWRIGQVPSDINDTRATVYPLRG